MGDDSWSSSSDHGPHLGTLSLIISHLSALMPIFQDGTFFLGTTPPGSLPDCLGVEALLPLDRTVLGLAGSSFGTNWPGAWTTSAFVCCTHLCLCIFCLSCLCAWCRHTLQLCLLPACVSAMWDLCVCVFESLNECVHLHWPAKRVSIHWWFILLLGGQVGALHSGQPGLS